MNYIHEKRKIHFVSADLGALGLITLRGKFMIRLSPQGAWKKFQQVLEKVPDVEPDEHDKL